MDAVTVEMAVQSARALLARVRAEASQAAPAT
jgi:hypothetical protein